ncbi:MAG TPA: septum site-determining protein MinC [Oligoflexia bacterium]|nr:septum site-determining protein MinC [Oligoflexia bacterium]HMP47724.1 septum site-determining protein MinC [Oligoflexia bacterium]
MDSSFISGENLKGTLNPIDTDSETATVISARGTEEGLILRIDGKAPWSEVLKEIEAFLGGKKRFFEGGEISIEWLEQLPTKEQSLELESYLKSNFGIGVVQRKRRLNRFLKPASKTVLGNAVNSDFITSRGRENLKDSDGDELLLREFGGSSPGLAHSLDLFEDNEMLKSSSNFASVSSSPAIENLLDRVEKLASGDGYEGLSREGAYSFTSGVPLVSGAYTERVAQYLGADLVFDEEANARIVTGTLRSGQRIETPFSLIVLGDVNPGADLIAGGDVVVIGSLRGTAHAGAYEDDNLDRVVIALQMQPMQLRIGSVVSRGSGEVGRGPEIARIDNRMIVVEPYSARLLNSAISGRKR